MDYDLNVRISIEELIGVLMNADEDDIFKIITDLDEHICDWDFTNKLYEHFKQLHEEFLEEIENEKKD